MIDFINIMIPFLSGDNNLNSCLDKVVEKMNELCNQEIKERMKHE